MMITNHTANAFVLGAVVLAGCLVSPVSAEAQQAEPCATCGWSPPRATAAVSVRTVGELRSAVSRAKPGTTILLGDGVYNLGGEQLDISVRGLVLRGRNGARARVLIRGRGMNERMAAIFVTAPDVTISDLTISQVGFHGIHVRGGAGTSGLVIHHVHILDVGQQLIKGSTAAGDDLCRNGLVACSTLEYTESAPSDYTNGIDVHNGAGWVVRDNVLRRIRGPRKQGYRAGPTILFWNGSRDTVVERNWLVDCYRGIALGLVQDHGNSRDHLDHKGGVIRRNVICNLNPWADEAIEVNGSPDAVVEHNTVFVEGKVPWSIGIRFPTASARVWNNLSNHEIVLRDGAKGELKANLVTARRGWFVDAARGDLRLARGDVPAVDAGIVVPRAGDEPAEGGKASFAGSAPDVGAFERRDPR
jgi:hypothetical protein